jgi:hypothetical protein
VAHAEVIKGELDLVGVDSNAFAIMGAAIRALKAAGNGPDVVKQYQAEAMSGDYDNLIRVTLEYTRLPDPQ